MGEEAVINAMKKAIWLVNAQMVKVVEAVDMDNEVEVVTEPATNVKNLVIWLVIVLKKVQVVVILVAAAVEVFLVVATIPILVVVAAAVVDVVVITVEMLIISPVIVTNHATWIMLNASIAKALVICLAIAHKLLVN